jgi:hypothetical protein
MTAPVPARSTEASATRWQPDGAGWRDRIGVLTPHVLKGRLDDLERPVLTANQVAFRQALRGSGVRVSRGAYGRLLYEEARKCWMP